MPLLSTSEKTLVAWAEFISKIRTFFVERNFLEVSTPLLVTEGAFESSIDPLKVSWSRGRGELHTSPEIEMKTLFASLKRPLFQICKCFRDDLESPHHALEFTMLEFYQPDVDYQAMKNLVMALIDFISPSPQTFLERQVSDLLKEKANVALSEIKEENWEDDFFRLWIDHVETSLNPAIPTIITDYPIRVSPLSRQIPGTELAERFELYWKGMEICNGCTELGDAEELKRRHAKESKKREQNGKPPHPFSDKLVQSTSRMGKAAGVAVGLDRLFLSLSPAS